jgi:hypothetical protein
MCACNLVLLQLNFRDQQCAYSLLDGTLLFASPAATQLFDVADPRHLIGANLSSFLWVVAGQPLRFPLQTIKPLLARTNGGYLVWIQPIRVPATDDVLLLSRAVLTSLAAAAVSGATSGSSSGGDALLPGMTPDAAWSVIVNVVEQEEPVDEEADDATDDERQRDFIEACIRANKQLLLQSCAHQQHHAISAEHRPFVS